MIWDQRYASADYVYGTDPNEFLAETIRGLDGGGRALCLAEGEGRNAVFLAGSGYEGALDALAAVPEVECVEVAKSPGWRGIWLKQSQTPGIPSEPDGYPVPRGTVLQRSGNSILLWIAGNAPRASLRGDYYQGKKNIPRPINLIRHAGAGPLEVATLEALALSKMDWNNDALYEELPVTIRYSQKLARTIANVPSLPGKAYPYRLFM